MKRSLGICIKHNFRESIILICHSIVVRSFDRSIVWLFCHSAFCSHRNNLLFWVSICLGARLWRFFVNMNYITSYCSSSDTTPSTILNSVNAWMKAYDTCFFYAFDSSIRTSFILITESVSVETTNLWTAHAIQSHGISCLFSHLSWEKATKKKPSTSSERLCQMARIWCDSQRPIFTSAYRLALEPIESRILILLVIVSAYASFGYATQYDGWLSPCARRLFHSVRWLSATPNLHNHVKNSREDGCKKEWWRTDRRLLLFVAWWLAWPSSRMYSFFVAWGAKQSNTELDWKILIEFFQKFTRKINLSIK